MHRSLGAAIQILGLIVFTVGVGMVAVWAGVVVGGFSAFAVGVQLERESVDGPPT